MLDLLDSARRYLRAFVELGFLFLLATLVIYLILGEGAGTFVVSVANNIMNFADDVPTASLVGIGGILAIVYVLMQRLPPPQASRRPEITEAAE